MLEGNTGIRLDKIALANGEGGEKRCELLGDMGEGDRRVVLVS
jgi:hypothetical protein